MGHQRQCQKGMSETGPLVVTLARPTRKGVTEGQDEAGVRLVCLIAAGRTKKRGHRNATAE